GALDARVLAAAHRAVARPSAARRWGVPVSLAALLVLAVGVTLEMQHEQPGRGRACPASATDDATRTASAIDGGTGTASATDRETRSASAVVARQAARGEAGIARDSRGGSRQGGAAGRGSRRERSAR